MEAPGVHTMGELSDEVGLRGRVMKTSKAVKDQWEKINKREDMKA